MESFARAAWWRRGRALPFAFAFGAVALLATACHEVHFTPETEPGVIDIYDDLFSVSVPSKDHVVAGGYWGAIYVSEDGGNTWKKGETGTRRLIYGVSMADDLHGWAVGQTGLILRTEDGGYTWTKQKTSKEEEGTHLFSVHAIDANTAWAVGDWGTRIYTDSGGRNWEDRSLTIDEFHPQFVWLSPAEQEKVRKGEKVFEDVGLTDVYCRPLPSQSCWIIGEFGYVFHSENHGRTWERAQIESNLGVEPIVLGYDDIDLPERNVEDLKRFAKSIRELQHLNVAVSPRASAAEIAAFAKPDDPTPLFDILEARTQSVATVLEDAGLLSDRIRKREAPPWDYEDFLGDDPDFLKRYLDRVRADQPGVDVEVAQNPYLFSVRFGDDEHGYIAGLGGVVLISEDGGRTWSYRDTGRKQAIFSLSPLDGRVIAVGEKGFVRVSTDGGQNWQSPQKGFPNVFTFMRDIRFSPDGSRGFIVGERGMILRSEDAGIDWSKVLPPPEAERAAGG
jgi:photosystem II stability/assembly factor-like uncharacterized protein